MIVRLPGFLYSMSSSAGNSRFLRWFICFVFLRKKYLASSSVWEMTTNLYVASLRKCAHSQRWVSQLRFAIPLKSNVPSPIVLPRNLQPEEFSRNISSFSVRTTPLCVEIKQFPVFTEFATSLHCNSQGRVMSSHFDSVGPALFIEATTATEFT